MRRKLQVESERDYRKEKNRFYILRSEKNLTVEKLAKILNISVGNISALENGKNNGGGVAALTQYKKYFGVSFEYLLGENEAREPQNQVVSKELGLDDDSIKTLQMILAQDEDLVKFTNAFLGGGAETISFIRGFYEHFKNTSPKLNSENINLDFYKDISQYFYDIMYPKLKIKINESNKFNIENLMNEYEQNYKNMYESLPEDVWGF